MPLTLQLFPPTATHKSIAKWGSLAAILIAGAYHLSQEYGVHIVVDGKPVAAKMAPKDESTESFTNTIKSAYPKSQMPKD